MTITYQQLTYEQRCQISALKEKRLQPKGDSGDHWHQPVRDEP
ncbi:MAG: hypothetical protein QS721_03300 [Candidatus Endonucleobacter sp. (ex Gigantidas childressi)]|nr:hypothetical protein [Candidatus Endonucleobacter sp. (ex Gigantidas childressi)]